MEVVWKSESTVLYNTVLMLLGVLDGYAEVGTLKELAHTLFRLGGGNRLPLYPTCYILSTKYFSGPSLIGFD